MTTALTLMPAPPPVSRLLDLPALLRAKSHFLLGPRQTGKSFWLRRSLPDARIYDLLDASVYLALSRDPGLLAQEFVPGRPIVVDEIQRLPTLLHEVHRLIEERGARFLLTGSSARRLRAGGVNLLGGRARTKRLHPFSARELRDRFRLERALRWGLLPPVWFSEEPTDDLDAYAGTYLQQEVVAEGAVRNAPAFSRFLRVAALCNATIVNFTEVASDAQVPRTTVYEYFEILRDTMVLHEVPAWRESRRRKPTASSKFYLFDTGVAATLQGRDPRPGTPEYGAAFETWLHHELLCRSDYATGESIAHWRSTSGLEVDFVVGDHTAVEAKAKATVSAADLRGLRALGEERIVKRLLCVALVPRRRTVDGVTVLPWQEFLDALWDGEYR
jgi:predicted AAA+ superfamily ATPase